MEIMKKTALLCAACVFTLTACQSTGTVPAADSPAKPDSHNARIALDYEGRYEVGKPVSGNDIREVVIKSGSRYVATLANGINVSGLYSWDESGSRIILDIRGEPCPFFVGENFLKLEGAGKQKDWVFRKF